MTLGRPAPIAITSGEPAGIGPELTARLLPRLLADTTIRYLYIGPAEQLAEMAGDFPLVPVFAPAEAAEVPVGSLAVYDLPPAAPVRPGTPDPANAKGVIEAIRLGAEWAQAGAVSALVTNPIQKAALKAVGFAHQGHTDYLAALAGLTDADVVMVLAAETLKVACVTHHLPLREVAGRLDTDTIVGMARILSERFPAIFGGDAPRIAVAGLNPHAGEAGNLGAEDADIIAPAIAAMGEAGIAAFGPCPADSLFTPEARAGYDVALCMYHDQALIPVKALGGRRVVNVTLGLPYVRTSPGHGTALDIAGLGKADPIGLEAALDLAVSAARRRLSENPGRHG